MLRASPTALMRLPKCRRPRNRSWEFANVQSFGLKEGGQNYRTWILSFTIITSIFIFEMYQQWKRIEARGDTCPACESAREHYRERQRQKDALFDPRDVYDGDRVTGSV